jgi:hypothetical protein
VRGLSVAALVALCGCLGAGPPGPGAAPVPALAPALATLPEPEELRAALADLLAAHEACRFPPPLRERVPAPPADWRVVESAGDRYCLGRLVLVGQAWQTPTLASFDLETGRRSRWRREVFLVVASHHEGRWYFTWPTPLGPPLEESF